MNEINCISLNIAFRLIIIRLEYLFWLMYPHFFYFDVISLLG